MRHVRELDSLRCIAILSVLAVHFRPANDPRFYVFGLGWLGVDLFFAISGYLITSILLQMRVSRDRPGSLRAFYGRRVLRIFPAYYAVLLCIVTIAAILRQKLPLSRVAAAFTFTSAFNLRPFEAVRAHLLGAPLLSIPGAPIDHHIFAQMSSALTVFWSLSVEEIFYLVWAPIVLLGSRKLVGVAIVTPIVLCPIFRLFAHTTNFTECFSVWARFDAIMFGACTALLLHVEYSWRSTLRRLLPALTGLALVALFCITWRLGGFRGMELRSYLGFAVFGYSLVGIACAAVVASCVAYSETPFLGFLRLQPSKYIGKISYTIYLIHIPTFIVVYDFIYSKRGSLPISGLLSSFIVVLLSGLSWRYYESPILKFKDRLFPPGQSERRIPALATTKVVSRTDLAEASSV
jgi:peptidoglycan/LPS O-acetylase OafA/YrhL